jgi:ABC-type transport system involved in multi-copper enzyme maturation permease subunit
LSSQIYILSGRSDSSFLRALGKVIYYLLPNLESLNFRPQAAYAVRVTGGEIWNAVAVGVGYSAVMIGLAVLIFSRRDFK